MNSLAYTAKRPQRLMLPTASLGHADDSVAVTYERCDSRRGAEFARGGPST